MKMVLPQLQSWRDFFAKAVKKSYFSGSFGLVLKKRKHPVWGHYSGQYMDESYITFPMYKQKDVTYEKYLFCFLRFFFFFLINTTASPDLRQR